MLVATVVILRPSRSDEGSAGEERAEAALLYVRSARSRRFWSKATLAMGALNFGRVVSRAIGVPFLLVTYPRWLDERGPDGATCFLVRCPTSGVRVVRFGGSAGAEEIRRGKDYGEKWPNPPR